LLITGLRPIKGGRYLTYVKTDFIGNVYRTSGARLLAIGLLVLCIRNASAARIRLAVRRLWFLLPTIAVRRGASIDRYPKRALKASNMPGILLRQSGNPD